MPNAPCPVVSRLTVSRLPRGHVFGYPCDAASAAAYGRLPEWPKGTVCKTVGSAYVGSNPTPATTCGNGPLAAETRPRGRFRSCHAVYQGVSLCVDVSRCPRTYSGRRPGRLHGRCTPSAFHGRPRTAPAKGALSLPRCGAGAMRRPTAGIARDGRARRRQKDERCGRPWLLLPEAQAGSSCTGEGARPGRLSLNVIHPGRPGGPDPSRTMLLCLSRGWVGPFGAGVPGVRGDVPDGLLLGCGQDRDGPLQMERKLL